MLYIFNREEELVGILDNKSTNPSLFYSRAAHTEQLNGLDILEFDYPSNEENAELIKEGYSIAFKIQNNKFKLFEVKQITDMRDGYHNKTVYCESSMLELFDEIIKDKRPTSVEAWRALEIALEGTRWTVGEYEPTELKSTNFYYENVLSAQQKIIETWGVELTNHIEVSGNKIVKRAINIKKRIGKETGKRFEYTKDLLSIKRTIDMSELKTAIIPRGKGVEIVDGDGEATGGYGRRINIEEVVWEKPKNPLNKPLGQEYLEDPEAKELYGRLNPDGTKRNLTMVLELSSEEDPEVLIQAAYDELQVRKVPQIEYEAKVIDLGDLFDHEKVEIGDSVTAIDRSFNPPLRFTSRIVEIKRTLGAPENTEVKFGNLLPTLATKSSSSAIADLSNKVDEALTKIPTRNDILQGGIPVDHLEGAINVAQNEIISNGGYVQISDYDGILILDRPTYEEATRAIQLKGGILGISNEKDEEGFFVFRTFGTGDGFVADEITSGTIRSELIKIDGKSQFGEGYDPTKKIDVDYQNISKNGDFSLLTYGWGASSWGWGEVISEDKLKEQTNQSLVMGVGKTGGNVLEIRGKLTVYGDQLIRVVPDRKYKIRVRVRATAESSTTEGTKLNIGFVNLNSNGKLLGTHKPIAAYEESIKVADGWVEYEGYMTGTGEEINNFESSTYYIRPYLNFSQDDGNGTIQYDEVKIWIDGDPNLTSILAAESATNLVAKDSEGFIDISSNALRQSSNFYWDNNGFFAIDATNSNRIVRINSGGIGISENGGQTFKTALTGYGLVADVITAGTMLFDRIKGGTLTLGGEQNEQGKLYVMNDKGEVTVQLTGNQRGFNKLYVGELTSPTIINKTDKPIAYYVDVIGGSDENSGANWLKPFKTFQKAIDSVPKFLTHDVVIYSHYGNNLIIDENIKIEGFHGSGELLIDFARPDRNQVIYGSIEIVACTARINITNLSVSYKQNSGLDACIYVKRCSEVIIYNCALYCNLLSEYGLAVRNSFVTFRTAFIYYPKSACILSGYGAHVDAGDTAGLCAKYGILVTYAAQVSSYGTIPRGYLANAIASVGGYLPTATQTATYSEGVPATMPVKRFTANFKSISGDSYLFNEGWSSAIKGENYVYQGISNGQNHHGMWFFGGEVSKFMKDKQIQRVRIKVKRSTLGGHPEGSTLYFRTHSNATKPASVPHPTEVPATATIGWGEEKWIDISTLKNNFLTGADGISVYVNEPQQDNEGAEASMSRNYVLLEPNVELEFIYITPL